MQRFRWTLGQIRQTPYADLQRLFVTMNQLENSEQSLVDYEKFKAEVHAQRSGPKRPKLGRR